MLVIGLTGNLASGKSTVAALLKGLGAEIINADNIAHQTISRKGAAYKKVVKKFGKNILDKGEISKRKLAQIVFNDPLKLRALERIVHPAVRREMLKAIKRSQKKVVVIEVPLLFEAGFDQDADLTIVVKASRRNQIARSVKRLKITRAEALKRIKRQMPQAEKIRRADFIIDNNKNINQTKKQVLNTWQKIQSKTKN